MKSLWTQNAVPMADVRVALCMIVVTKRWYIHLDIYEWLYLVFYKN